MVNSVCHEHVMINDLISVSSEHTKNTKPCYAYIYTIVSLHNIMYICMYVRMYKLGGYIYNNYRTAENYQG